MFGALTLDKEGTSEKSNEDTQKKGKEIMNDKQPDNNRNRNRTYYYQVNSSSTQEEIMVKHSRPGSNVGSQIEFYRKSGPFADDSQDDLDISNDFLSKRGDQADSTKHPYSQYDGEKKESYG